MQSLTRDEVRNIDRYAIQTFGVSGLVLMENAGRQVADAAARLADSLGTPQAGAAGRSFAIVAGAGNNGGDGFVAARHLHLRGCHGLRGSVCGTPVPGSAIAVPSFK